MTFYEAAVEVLRRTGRPLHYKKITEIAVRENLLSHEGKTPHLTMNDRLERELQKENGSVIGQERPGVYQLDEEHAKKLTREIRKRERKRKKKQQKQRKKQRQKQRQTSESGGDSSGKKRRRTRGSETDQAAKKRKRTRDDSSSDKKRRRQRSDDNQRDEESKKRSRRQQTDQKEAAAEPAATISRTEHLDQGPARLRGISKAARKVLDEGDDAPMEVDELADEIFDRKLVKFHTHDPIATVKSALANDNQIRENHGHRPLFAQDRDGRWYLTEWNLSETVHSKEQAVLSLSEEIRQQTMSELGGALRGIQSEALEHLALTLLERLGYHNIKVSKRSSEGDVFFTADWRQGLADVRVCVRVVTDHDRTLQGDAVSDLRETLDHYSASEGVIIHLGDISDGAIDLGRKDDSAPIKLLDNETFVELLVKHGIGVQTYNSSIVTVDQTFIDDLAQ